MKRIRLALVTHLWPVAAAPHAGKPIYETALRMSGDADIEVFCPVPRYPRAGWLRPRRWAYRRAEPEQAPPGLTTQYLEYATLPGVGRPFNGLGTENVLGPALRAWKPDIILAYWLYPTAWAAWRAGRRLGVPVVAGSRGSDLHRIPGPLVRRMTSATVRGADMVITVTEDLRREAIRLGASDGRTRVIPNGCDRGVFHPIRREDARRELSLPPNGRMILQVGHLIESKGVLDLWRAFELLAAQDPDLDLALVGEGPATARVRELAERSGLLQRLLLPGVRPASEIALWMNAGDVVCLASHGEGCPNVVIEALCCGRPVVGTNVGGIPDLVGDECGYLAPVRNPSALADGVSRALRRVWEAQDIVARFSRSWDDVARETLAACMESLAHRSARQTGQAAACSPRDVT